jgi:hypothetical protein
MKTYKITRREEAVARQEVYKKLSPAQKLARLDAKLGDGQGAIKERVKLQRVIEKAANK